MKRGTGAGQPRPPASADRRSGAGESAIYRAQAPTAAAAGGLRALDERVRASPGDESGRCANDDEARDPALEASSLYQPLAELVS